MKKNKKAKIDNVRKNVINLKNSPLYEFRIKNKYNPVIGEGNLDAKIMLVGEAPGENEALTGRPFVGVAGKLLDTLLNEISLSRKNIYITSVLLDRPPGNKTPTKREINFYAPFLFKQINIIQPKVIGLLGKIAIDTIFGYFGIKDKAAALGKIHGKIFEVKLSYGDIKLIPLYHPAAAFYNRSLEKVMKEDFQKLKSIIS